MKLVQTCLNSKSVLACLTAAVMLMCLTGCGKSEAQKAAELKAVERHDARQKLKDAVAAVVVRTKGSTCAEFRQSRLELETCYEANKANLADVEKGFSDLSIMMSATEYCWSYSIKCPECPLPWKSDNEGTMAACLIRPSIAQKLDYTYDQRIHDKDFTPGNYVRLGLTKTKEQCDLVMSTLDKTN